jgi:hypothetical protein
MQFFFVHPQSTLANMEDLLSPSKRDKRVKACGRIKV